MQNSVYVDRDKNESIHQYMSNGILFDPYKSPAPTASALMVTVDVYTKPFIIQGHFGYFLGILN